jgi:hypothetical protein
MSVSLYLKDPVKNRVKIDPLHPLVCHKRQLNGGGPSDEPGKTEVLPQKLKN